MAWNSLEFESIVKQALIEKYQAEKGNSYFSKYETIRNLLLEDGVFEKISGAEPSLTDHGPTHIANVINNVGKLVHNRLYFQPIELQLLLYLVLFHDIGNVFGRTDHNRNISKVYNHFAKEILGNQWRTLIITGVAAHCGSVSNGSRNTLATLNNRQNLEGETIRLQELASILRFADELAEGPQRTSRFFIENGLYKEDSHVFHQYATISDYCIDSLNERVSIAFTIELDSEKHVATDFSQIIKYLYKRVDTVDVERRYARSYSSILSPFKSTNITFNFYKDGMPQTFESIGDVQITDPIPVPGECFNEPGLNALLPQESLINEIERIMKLDGN